MNYNFNDYEMDLFFKMPLRHFDNKHDEEIDFIRPDYVTKFSIMYGYKANDKEHYKIRFFMRDGNYVDTEYMPGITVMAYLKDFENKLEFVIKRVK